MKRFRITKSGHLFQNIFLVSSLLLVFMLAYMTFFMDRFVVQAKVQQLDESNLRMLEQASQSISQEVNNLELQTRMFLSDQNILQYLLSPNYYGTEQCMEILSDLKQYVTLTPSVTRMWLYAQEADTVFSSEGYLTARSGSWAKLLLDRQQTQQAARSAADLRLSALVLRNNLYIMVDFVPATRLACFIFEVDAHQLGIAAGEDQPPILITDDHGCLLLEDGSVVQRERQYDLTASDSFYTQASTSRSDRQHYYRVANDKLNWDILMEISESGALYDRASFWMLILPFLAVLLLLGAAGAYVITRVVYTPINRLMNLVMDRSGAQDVDNGSVDYLESAYQQTLQDNDQLRTQFSALGREMCQYLCREAIDGRLNEGTDTDAVLELIPEGRFQVALIRLGASGVALQSPIKHKLQLSALENLAQQLPEHLCCLEEERDTLVLVLRVFEDTDTSQLLSRFLSTAAEQTQCRLLHGLGESQPSLYQLKESYDTAARDLQYNIYMSSDPDPITARTLRRKALEDRLSHAIDQAILSREAEDVQAELIAHAAEHDTSTPEERLQNYRRAQELFMEKIQFQEEALLSAHLLRDDTPRETDREEFLTFCRQALEVSRTLAGKKKYRYVEEGKKFIQENYSDCSLSVNDISVHVGISPSYFSSLFNEMLQESVTSYLNRIRVEQAKNMLSVTRVPIKDIGFRCGFNSANVFGRVFKKYTGQSPKQFRDDCAKRQEGVSHE